METLRDGLGSLYLSQATGGGDCSIRLYPLEASSSVDVAISSTLLSEGVDGTQGEAAAPRSVFLVGQTPICLTDRGYA